MPDTFTCDRCGRVFESRQLKEVMYEEGRERIRKEFCPRCLDEVMNHSASVRGIAGERKRAAVHLDPGSGTASHHESFGTRGSG